MSVFGSLLGDFDEDAFFGAHMRHQMNHMNQMMSTIFSNPFGMLGGAFESPFENHGFGTMMPNLNCLLDAGGGGHSYSTSTIVSMSAGADGRPQVYKATSSTRTAPGGITETQRTVQDSRTGTKKMAIGHHIGDRAHIIEKEQNVHTGDQEERQDFINLEEDEAEDFDREWHTKTRARTNGMRAIGNGRHPYSHYARNNGDLLAITAGPSTSNKSVVHPRRPLRPSSDKISARTPYSPPGHPTTSRRSKNIKTVSGPSSASSAPSAGNVIIEELE